MKKLSLLVIAFSAAMRLFSQQAGLPFIRTYTFDEYGGNPQNWAIAEDSRGVMYFGNGDGLLEYDGAEWKLIKVPIVRSMAIDSSGIIYTGLENDFGYLKADAAGNYRFKSLKSLMPPEYKDISTVWDLSVSGKKVAFTSSSNMFIYESGHIKAVTEVSQLHILFRVNGRFYFRERGRGLFTWKMNMLSF
jgi:hypothetical protein